MRPLPRLHAVTDAAVIAAPDFGVRAAAIAAAGSAVALHARDRTAGGAMLARLAHPARSPLARPPEAAVFVNGRPDVAARRGRPGRPARRPATSPPADARRVFGPGWIGRSVHGVAEAEPPWPEGADFLLVGSVYPTASTRAARRRGSTSCARAAALGRPVIAIGGIDAGRARRSRARPAPTASRPSAPCGGPTTPPPRRSRCWRHGGGA